jgi:hypothetical protein
MGITGFGSRTHRQSDRRKLREGFGDKPHTIILLLYAADMASAVSLHLVEQEALVIRRNRFSRITCLLQTRTLRLD